MGDDPTSDPTDAPDNEGVWVAYYNDYGVHITAIYATELEALRAVNGDPSSSAGFVSFGADVNEVLR